MERKKGQARNDTDNLSVLSLLSRLMEHTPNA